MAEKSILNIFKTIDIPQTEYDNLIITEDKFKNLIELLEQYRRCGRDIKNEELTLILQLILNVTATGGSESCAFKKECWQRFEKENEEALVQGVEFGLDNNLNVDLEDIEKYKEITSRK